MEEKNMKIAVLYICTGHYRKFFEGFYTSAKKYFLPSAERHFFVWTDGTLDDLMVYDSSDTGLNDAVKSFSDVTVIHRECAGFPDDSLFRFEMFLEVEDQLGKFDYIYFINANAQFLKPIGAEILPDETGLAMGRWPKRDHQNPVLYPYERNRKSLAYVEPCKPPYIYYMGGLNGGTSSAYLEMVRILAMNIRDDYSRGIVAKVHDESYINAYLRSHPCKILPTYLNMPEEFVPWYLDGKETVPEVKMIFREKTSVDPYFSKGRSSGPWATFRKACNVAWDAIRWYLRF